MPLFGPRTPAGEQPRASTLSIIASGMVVTGDVRCDGVLRIDGTLAGRIIGARQLVVTPGGRIHGDVTADEIVVGGVIDGNVHASTRLELQESAVVNGNIETRAFVVPEGGQVNGDIRMVAGAVEQTRTSNSSS
jgi:cytoskeletal protein CcmA (bactofilin family)